MSGVDSRAEVELGARLVFFEAARDRRLDDRELAERFPLFGCDSFCRLCSAFTVWRFRDASYDREGYSIYRRRKPLQLHTSSSMLLPSSTRLLDAGVTRFFRAYSMRMLSKELTCNCLGAVGPPTANRQPTRRLCSRSSRETSGTSCEPLTARFLELPPEPN